MDLIFQAIVLGVVQGLTEFLPISSSAHLIIVPRVLGWNDPALNSASFDVMLHMGTLVALLVYFGRDLLGLLRAFIDSIRERHVSGYPERRLAWLIFISMLPGALLGAFLESKIDEFFHDPDRVIFVAVLLAAGATLLWAADRWTKHTRTLDDLRVRDAVIIGIAQAGALFSGISRSGITIAAGLFIGLERGAAARFSFLMAVPIIAGAGLWKSRVFILGAGPGDVPMPIVPLLAGMVAAAIAGLAAISLLLSYLRRSNTDVFVIYRLGLALFVVAFVLTR